MSDEKRFRRPIDRKRDRVRDLANEVCQTLSRFYKVNEAEEHLAALFLAEMVVKQLVVAKYGPAALNRVVTEASELKSLFDAVIAERAPEVPDTVYEQTDRAPEAQVVQLFRKDEPVEETGPGPIPMKEDKDEGA